LALVLAKHRRYNRAVSEPPGEGLFLREPVPGHAAAVQECFQAEADRPTADHTNRGAAGRSCRRNVKDVKMPKLKTKSGAKKRFKLTATGKVKTAQAGKRHGMIKRTAKFIRNARGTTTLSDADAKIVKQFLNG